MTEPFGDWYQRYEAEPPPRRWHYWLGAVVLGLSTWALFSWM